VPAVEIPATSDNIPGTLVLRDASGSVGLNGSEFSNTAIIKARSSTGALENSFTPRWSDNVSYLDLGDGGLRIRSFNPSVQERIRINAAGEVGIGGTANAASLLDVASTTKGFLPPRMTTAQRDAIASPPAGLMIYNTTTNKLNVRTASSWEAVTSA